MPERASTRARGRTVGFMGFKLTQRITDHLIKNLRDAVDRIRAQEKVIMSICVSQAHMPRKDFITSPADVDVRIRCHLDGGTAELALRRVVVGVRQLDRGAAFVARLRPARAASGEGSSEAHEPRQER